MKLKSTTASYGYSAANWQKLAKLGFRSREVHGNEARPQTDQPAIVILPPNANEYGITMDTVRKLLGGAK